MEMKKACIPCNVILYITQGIIKKSIRDYNYCDTFYSERIIFIIILIVRDR